MSRTDLGSEARRDIAGGSPRTVICQIMISWFHGLMVSLSLDPRVQERTLWLPG